MPISHRILVVRNDKLGDFMLAWPALKALRKASPDNHIAVLVPDYTAPMARLCPWVDEVVIDPGEGQSKELHNLLLKGHYDALLTLFSTPRVGLAARRAHIPLRLAPATKWAQIFYNIRVKQRRSRSEKPEYIYNIELAEALAHHLNQHPPRVKPPYWPLPQEQRNHQRQRLEHELELPPLPASSGEHSPQRRLWILHPGSGGSAVNLSATRYRELVARIEKRLATPVSWLISWGPGEQDTAREMTQALIEAGSDARLMPPRQGLDDFAHTIAAADGMIAGSTGPLHIAGCLDIATVGFYPAKRSATALRWQTCNDEHRRLAFSPPFSTDKQAATNMELIDLAAAAPAIARLIEA